MYPQEVGYYEMWTCEEWKCWGIGWGQGAEGVDEEGEEELQPSGVLKLKVSYPFRSCSTSLLPPSAYAHIRNLESAGKHVFRSLRLSPPRSHFVVRVK